MHFATELRDPVNVEHVCQIRYTKCTPAVADHINNRIGRLILKELNEPVISVVNKSQLFWTAESERAELVGNCQKAPKSRKRDAYIFWLQFSVVNAANKLTSFGCDIAVVG